MQISLFQIDAFADKVFSGNPAAVCPLEHWLDDATLQNIACENNLAETAFFVKMGNTFHIRWLTPKAEVDLCGHATLAAAHVIFTFLNHHSETVQFQSRSGKLSVRKEGEWLVLNFPADTIERIDVSQQLSGFFDRQPTEIYRGRTDFMFVYSSRRDIETIRTNFNNIVEANARGVIITAPGTDTDLVSRFFAPTVGVNEDPVTGSAHTTLIPYWSERLSKTELTARQLSARRGDLKCRMLGDRVEIGGRAVFYMSGEIAI